ncbi:MAG: glycogen debranching enzyme, partial [Cellulomonas sp. 14-74-6]
CQDNEIAWVDWDLDEDREELLEFARRVIQLRSDHAVFRRRRFFAGRPDHGGESDLRDIAWFTPAGQHMEDSAWNNDQARSVMVFLNGEAIVEPDGRGEPIVDDSFLMLFNGHFEKTTFALPKRDYGEQWTAVLDTDSQVPAGKVLRPRARLTLAQRSLVLLTRPPAAPAPVASGSGAAEAAAREAAKVRRAPAAPRQAS